MTALLPAPEQAGGAYDTLFKRPYRAKATLVRNLTVRVCHRLGDHSFFCLATAWCVIASFKSVGYTGAALSDPNCDSPSPKYIVLVGSFSRLIPNLGFVMGDTDEYNKSTR